MRLPTVALMAVMAVSGGTSAVAQETHVVAAGASRQSAIEVCKPEGERAYLSRLVCPDGSRPVFERAGSVGNRNDLPPDLDRERLNRLLEAMLCHEPLGDGATDYHVVDLYELQCGNQRTQVHLDMYHCDAATPDVAPVGFSLRH